MPELPIYDMQKKKVGSIPLPASLEEGSNPYLLHRAVVAQQTNRRQGTAKVKNRSEVTGSTRKLYRQKGTGRARHGDIKAPIFVGGGRAFGPHPREWEIRLPQKERRAALRSALAQKRQEGKLWIVDVDFKEPKTKRASEFFAKFEIPGALVVVDGNKPATVKSIRNLPHFKVCRVEAVAVLDILRYDHLVMAPGSLKLLMDRLGGGAA